MRGALLVLGTCVAVLVLGGCGGGDDSASTSSSTSEAAQEATTADTPQPSPQSTRAEPRAGEESKQDKSPAEKAQGKGSKQSNAPSKPPKPVKPPPISSAPKAGSKHPAPGVKTVSGGDNSVQEYGVEADESERREASIALATYLGARAEGNWSGACSLLAQRPTEQIEKLAGDKADCAEVLAGTAKGTSSQPGSTIIEVLSFRGQGDIPGDPAYLIFKGPPDETLFSMPMYLQGGAWKVGLAQPSELPV